MVATLSKLTDPAAAAAYYEADDYYTGDAKAPSRWHGKGAQALGLDGDVEPDTFAAMLKGQLPNGASLGTTRHGQTEHKLGWDLTFSAPKSVSVMGLVAGDRRLLDAHDRAVAVALDFAERHAATTRIREGESVERVATDNLTIATFPHFTARATEGQQPAPQVHTHSVILNAAQRADGQWRSIESQPLYKLQKDIGAIYHQQLAAEAQRLGYAVTIAPDSTFELGAVPQDIREAFSARSAQIEAALAERGQTRATASAAQKATIALDTRAPKEAIDHARLAASWREIADSLGFTENRRRAFVAEAEARSGTPTAQQRRLAADRAVALAAEHIAEREAVFSAAALERAAGNAAHGRVAHADILAAMTRAKDAKAIVARAVPRSARGVAGFATREGIATEQRMLALEVQGRSQAMPLHNRIDAARIVARAELAAAEHGYRWTQGQRDATIGLLLSPHVVTGIQGSAGTAKTTTVLATYAQAARARDMEVRALAPTATAAAVLARAIDAEPTTVAMMLGSTPEACDGEKVPAVWVVDEASMLGARDAERLLAQARAQGARLVLVGDVDQLGSVEAGRAFGQLQDAGMATFRLEEIVRQSNPHTRRAVEAMLEGNAAEAFRQLDAGGGAVIEQPDAQTRQAILARDFAALPREERAQTLVLDPTREGRQQLTDAIRAALIRDGTLGDEALIATVLEPRGLTRAEAREARSYQPGDLVTFRKSEKGRPRAGVGHRVEAVDVATGTVRLMPEVPAKRRTAPQPIDWQPACWGADVAEAFVEVEQEFRAGDRVQFTRNNYRAGRLNGHVAEVMGVDGQGASLWVQMEGGERQMLDLRHLADRHIRPGWVRTIHSSQGATCDRVMAHMESFRANTVDAASAYVAISRARKGASIYTDSRAGLTEALGLRDGAQVGAIDKTLAETKIDSLSISHLGIF